MELTIKRGDIYYAELNPVIGSEQGGTRPVLIISNDIGNKHRLYRRRHHGRTFLRFAEGHEAAERIG